MEWLQGGSNLLAGVGREDVAVKAHEVARLVRVHEEAVDRGDAAASAARRVKLVRDRVRDDVKHSRRKHIAESRHATSASRAVDNAKRRQAARTLRCSPCRTRICGRTARGVQASDKRQSRRKRRLCNARLWALDVVQELAGGCVSDHLAALARLGLRHALDQHGAQRRRVRLVRGKQLCGAGHDGARSAHGHTRSQRPKVPQARRGAAPSARPE